MANIQLHFNGNFFLKKSEISIILKAASEPKGLNDTLENLMIRTSLGNAKVGRIKSWAIRAALIEDNNLSKEGKIVFKSDPYLESITTDWLMHFYLSFGDKGLQAIPDNPSEWGAWTYFIYTFLPEHKIFTFEEFLEYSDLVFEQEKRIISPRIRYILKAYTEPHALAGCKFLTQDKNTYQSRNPRLPNPYLIGYFLAKLWERDFSKDGSVLTQSILNQKMGLGAVLGVSPQALQEQLNALEAYGIIEQRREVPPFQIIPRWDDPLSLLQKAYDLES
jgi:hypothetical protein